jgi:hypothetical protein
VPSETPAETDEPCGLLVLQTCFDRVFLLRLGGSRKSGASTDADGEFAPLAEIEPSLLLPRLTKTGRELITALRTGEGLTRPNQR